MIIPINGPYKITAPFNQPRPLNARVKDHIHGAIDLISLEDEKGRRNSEIIAPEAGDLYYFYLLRNLPTRNGFESLNIDKISPFDFRNSPYFYDIYGGVIMVISDDKKRTHFMTHSWINQITNRLPAPIGNKIWYKPLESETVERFPIILHHTFKMPYRVTEGETVGYIGSAGFSTGLHVHWEIHNGTVWNKHEDRIDPAKLLKLRN